MFKILIIAGEPSGDHLGADLMKEMVLQHSLNSSTKTQKVHPHGGQTLIQEKLIFQGIGGSLMKQQGLVSLFRIEDLAVMGLTEVLSSLPRIFSIMRRLVKYVNVWKPDLIITIDSPDFSTRFVKRVRKVDKFVPIIHYVAPSVWAWRPSRAKEMAKYYDQVLALLPFEVDCFRKVGLNCEFVGHPVARQILPSQNELNKFVSKMDLDLSKRIISVLPGSRSSEIHYMLPIFIPIIKELATKFSDLEFVIPTPIHVSKTIKTKLQRAKVNVKILSEEDITSEEFMSFKFSLFCLSTIALATSGSVSLELARAGTPMITAYRCGWMFEMVLKRFVKLQSANLINIVLGKIVVPEFLFEKCNFRELYASIAKLLGDPNLLIEQKEFEIEAVNTLVGDQSRPSEVAARSALSFIT